MTEIAFNDGPRTQPAAEPVGTSTGSDPKRRDGSLRMSGDAEAAGGSADWLGIGGTRGVRGRVAIWRFALYLGWL